MARYNQRRPGQGKPAKPAPASKAGKQAPARPARKPPGQQSGKQPSRQPSRQLDSLIPTLRPAEAGARPPARAAPIIPPTLWLENEMRRLHNPADYVLLYEGWLQRYHRYRGRYPQDPRRAFRQVAQGCWERILSG